MQKYNFGGASEDLSTLRVLTCEMSKACCLEVTHIDGKGYIYCAHHGRQRQQFGHTCRKLRPHEVTRLRKGLTIKY